MYSLSKRGDAPKSFAFTNRNNSPWVGVIFSSLFSIVAVYFTATESMNIYDVLMLATGTVSLYVYLAIAISQLKLRKKLEAEGVDIPFKMWLFPWLTYLVIIFIIGALITMVIEGTYLKEVAYTSVLALFIVGLGICAQKFNWGGGKYQNNKTAQNKINITDNHC